MSRLENTPLFEDLTIAQQTVLFSRTFHQGQNMSKTLVARNFYQAALTNNWSKAEQYLRGYDVKPKYYKQRVNYEADSLKFENLKMKIHNFFYLVSLVLLSTQLYAKEVEYTGKCKFNGYMEKFIDCLEKELASYDKELNELYVSTMKEFPSSTLRKSEKLWVKFKVADCGYIAAEVYSGREYQPIEKICLINKTKDRIADLKRSIYTKAWF